MIIAVVVLAIVVVGLALWIWLVSQRVDEVWVHVQQPATEQKAPRIVGRDDRSEADWLRDQMAG